MYVIWMVDAIFVWADAVADMFIRAAVFDQHVPPPFLTSGGPNATL